MDEPISISRDVPFCVSCDDLHASPFRASSPRVYGDDVCPNGGHDPSCPRDASSSPHLPYPCANGAFSCGDVPSSLHL